jgi:E3 ubiquitin-protein ligase UBR4
MMQQISGEDKAEVDVLVRAGELLNLAPVLRKIVSGNFTSHWCIDEVPYEELLEVKGAVSKVVQVAKVCQKSLQYFFEHIDFAVELVVALMKAAPQLSAAFAAIVCDLISHIIESYSDFGEIDCHQRSSIMREIVERLDVVVKKCGLIASDSGTRTATARILKAMWYSCETYRDEIVRVLMALMGSMRNYGHRANELLDFIKSIVMTDTDAIAMFETSVEKFCHGVRDTLLRVSDHPRADLYRALQQRQLLQSDASDKYWLEIEPSMHDVTSFIACHEFTNHALDSLKKNLHSCQRS